MQTNTLGQVIRQRRRELGLTQERLAERVGLTMRQSEIARLEADRVQLPRRERLEQLASALEMPMDELLVRSGWFQNATLAKAAVGDHQHHAAEDLEHRFQALEEELKSISSHLTEAQHLIGVLRRELNVTRNLRGETREPIGVIEEWETARTFLLYRRCFAAWRRAHWEPRRAAVLGAAARVISTHAGQSQPRRAALGMIGT